MKTSQSTRTNLRVLSLAFPFFLAAVIPVFLARASTEVRNSLPESELSIEAPSKVITGPQSTITVNGTTDVVNGADGLCTLREAIAAANNNTASGSMPGECAAGSNVGTDTIDLTGLTGTITLTSVLPNLVTDMILTGPGSGVLTIDRNSSTFVIFNIGSQSNPNANVSISGLSIQGRDPN